MNQVTKLARTLTSNYDPEVFLGHLCWYSVPDSVVISRNDFVDKLAKEGVPFGSNIPEIRPVDVFKRGCTASERNKYYPTDAERTDLGLPEGCHINYLFRNSGQDKDGVYRSLVREVVDSAGHKLAYEEICSVVYSRTAVAPTPVITHSPTKFALDVERDIVYDVHEYFAHEADRITPYSIREFVRKGLEWHLHAVKVRPSGGIYFIQEQFSTTVGNLEKVINDIGGSFHTMPLLDDSKQRQMLKKAFEDESLDDITVLMGEIREIMHGNKTITAERYADFKVRYDKLIKKVLEYSDVLDEAMETTSSYLELAEAQIKKLISHVKIDTP